MRITNLRSFNFCRRIWIGERSWGIASLIRNCKFLITERNDSVDMQIEHGLKKARAGEARVERSGLLLDKGSKMKQGLTIDPRRCSLKRMTCIGCSAPCPSCALSGLRLVALYLGIHLGFRIEATTVEGHQSVVCRTTKRPVDSNLPKTS